DVLPSISYLDLDKIKREHSYYNSRIPPTAVTNMPAPPLASPSSMYSGPPPPYSYPSSTASSVIGGHANGNGYISPPTEPRKTIDEEKEQQQSGRQSLPSIHEALNREQPLSITSLLTKSNVPPPPPSSYQARQSSNPSPTSPIRHSYADASLTGSTTAPARTRSSPIHSEAFPRTHHSPRPTLDTMSHRLPNNTLRESQYPPMLPPRTVPSPAAVGRAPLPSSVFRHSSPTYDSFPRSAPMVNPSQPHASYPTSYSYASPMATVAANYQPPSPSDPPNWRHGESEVERTRDYRPQSMKESIMKPTFGEAVKRHLDHFDLETSLNEVRDISLARVDVSTNLVQVAEYSGRTLEFSNLYGTRAHQTQRSGPMPGSLPTLAECDEVLGHQKRVLDSMQRIKEVIIAQQHALAEQRNYEKYNPPSEADEDGGSFHDKIEGSGGFAGSDPKKRRGVCQTELLLLVAVTVAIEQRPLNGVEAQTEHEPCATLADCVSALLL
ncbi:MAG: hypothetical protein Q9216_004541, partial [Gyalolechia sp. 2 TL-2023]